MQTGTTARGANFDSIKEFELEYGKLSCCVDIYFLESHDPHLNVVQTKLGFRYQNESGLTAGFCYSWTVLTGSDRTNRDSIRELLTLASKVDNHYTLVAKWHCKFRIEGQNGISTSISKVSS